MHRSSALAALAVSFAFLCQADTASADGIGKGNMINVGNGTIVSVNAGSMTFVCQWTSGDWSYQATANTVFRFANGASASFADLRPGEVVSVQYHYSGSTEVTDTVIISN